MKKLSFIVIALALVACGNEGDLSKKKADLKQKQSALKELKNEISELKQQIAELDTTATQKKEKTIPVKVDELTQRKFNHYVDLTGTVTSRENITISAEANGRAESISVEEGDKVSKGQTLIRINNDAVSRQLEEVRSVYNLAKTTFEKRKNLWDQNIGSEIEYLQAKNNFETAKSRLAQVRTQYENTIVQAPISGSVDELMINEGEFISMGMPIVRVVDLDDVEVEAELSEEYLPAVSKGDTVLVRIPALGVETKAPVTFVSQVINPENRSFKIKVALPNKDGQIKPNVLANLRVRDYNNEQALVVPSKAISKDLKGDFVYIAVSENGKTVARKKYIERGESSSDMTEVKSGLSAGDRVVISGYDQLNAGSTIEVKSA